MTSTCRMYFCTARVHTMPCASAHEAFAKSSPNGGLRGRRTSEKGARNCAAKLYLTMNIQKIYIKNPQRGRKATGVARRPRGRRGGKRTGTVRNGAPASANGKDNKLHGALDLHPAVLLLEHLCERRHGGLAVEHLLRVRAIRVLEEAHTVLGQELSRVLQRLESELVRNEGKLQCPVPVGGRVPDVSVRASTCRRGARP